MSGRLLFASAATVAAAYLTGTWAAGWMRRANRAWVAERLERPPL